MSRLDKDDGVQIDELPEERQKRMIRNIVNLGGERVDPEKLEKLSLDIYLQDGGIYANIQKIIDAVRKDEDDGDDF